MEVDGKLVVASVSENLPAGMKNCEDLVVGFFVGKHLSFSAVKLGVSKMWKLKSEVSIKLHGDCAFIFKFSDAEDRKKVLESGSFYITNTLFTLRPWTHLIEKSIADIKTDPIWVRIYGVPLHMWNEDGLSLIASYLGKPILVDDCTIKQSMLLYARICIEIDLDFSYPTSIALFIDGKFSFDLPIEYQWKPQKCEKCKVFGQSVKNCLTKVKSRWETKEYTQLKSKSRVMNGGNCGSSQESPTSVADEECENIPLVSSQGELDVVNKGGNNVKEIASTSDRDASVEQVPFASQTKLVRCDAKKPGKGC
ncbi:uncharacterized protein LOC113271871 [Papaver somniferum]|uniref:uncharacterized protein LOC113271871 n=1 Tax=Papaver somniferum TaxID=3469 RepID=UPI000E7046A7|nr:uncharacterized protein LOC113271871 [Papaver somniferum]